MITTETIRDFVRFHHIEPARAAGSKWIEVRCGEIARSLQLVNRFPMICNAMDARKWLRSERLALIKRPGPRQSSTVRWFFGL
jgi:hypothetical protein